MLYENHSELTNNELELLIGPEILMLNCQNIIPLVIDYRNSREYLDEKKVVIRFHGNRTFDFKAPKSNK